jgi:ankyrin repeat protein
VILALSKAGATLDGEPIWKCMEYKRYKCLAALLEGGVDVNQRGANEMTPLIYAVAHNEDIKMVRLILNFKPDLELKARFPFAFHGFPEIPIEERYNDATALMCAAGSGRLDMVKFLIEAGADPLTKDRHGKTALDIAKRDQKDDVVSFLKKIASYKAMADNSVRCAHYVPHL